MWRTILVTLVISISLDAAAADILIPRSMAGDKGKYYLLNVKTIKGNIKQITTKRVGINSVDYSKVEINCNTMRMRSLGESDVSEKEIKINPTKWFDLVPGSSKSDAANFACAAK